MPLQGSIVEISPISAPTTTAHGGGGNFFTRKASLFSSSSRTRGGSVHNINIAAAGSLPPPSPSPSPATQPSPLSSVGTPLFQDGRSAPSTPLEEDHGSSKDGTAGSGHLESKRSPPPVRPQYKRRTGSSRSISSSVSDIGASLIRSASLRSSSARSPTAGFAFPAAGQGNASGAQNGAVGRATGEGNGATSPDGHVQGFHSHASKSSLSLGNFARRKKSVESIRSLRKPSITVLLPPEGTYPVPDGARPLTPGLAGAQLRGPSPRPTGSAHSNIGFAEQARSTMAGAAPGVPALPAGMAASGMQNPHVAFNHIQETAAKRINTLDYFRKAHEGPVYWFNTLYHSPSDLRKLPSQQPPKLARRATNYLLLGFSLPQVMDLSGSAQSATEYLRTVNQVLLEFEQFQQLHPPDGSSSGSLGRGKIPQMFRRATTGVGKARRASSAADFAFNSFVYDGGAADPNGSNASSTTAVSAPTLSTQSSNLSTMSFGAGSGGDGAFAPHASWSSDPSFHGSGTDHNTYTLLMTPSLPFDPDFTETFATLCDVLIDVYRAVIELVNVPDKVGPGVGEMFAKVDGRVRKLLVAGIVREFEDAARGGVKAEVGGIGRVVLGGMM